MEEADAGFTEEKKALPFKVGQVRVKGREALRQREVVYQTIDEMGAGKMYAGDRKMARIVVTDQQVKSTVSNSDFIPTGAYGMAWVGPMPATLKVHAAPRTVKPGMKLQDAWSVSSSRKNSDDAIRATTIHEFGHLVHLDRSQPGFYPQHREIDALVAERFNAPDREQLTKYSATNKEEYFAESFAAYHLERDAFKRDAPKAFAMVERALRIRGIL